MLLENVQESGTARAARVWWNAHSIAQPAGHRRPQHFQVSSPFRPFYFTGYWGLPGFNEFPSSWMGETNLFDVAWAAFSTKIPFSKVSDCLSQVKGNSADHLDFFCWDRVWWTSFMGGTNFWGGNKEDDCFIAPSFDDRVLEVVAVFGSVQMAASRIINLQHHRIAQCHSVKITILGKEANDSKNFQSIETASFHFHVLLRYKV